MKSGCAGVPGDVTAQESTDWLGLLWSFAASLLAPDDEEEDIHQLTETLTRKKTSPHAYLAFNQQNDTMGKDADPA